MEDKVYNFIQTIKNIYNMNKKEIGWEYIEELNYYRVWHTKEFLESDKDNRKNISKLLRDFFSKEEVKNVIFTYDYLKRT